MFAEPVEVLRQWASGSFYPLSQDIDGRDALEDLADEMAAQPSLWWPSFRSLLSESGKKAVDNLRMPFAALLHVGGESMWNEVANAARNNRRIANAFWEAMEFLMLANEAYKRLGRQMTREAFVRHEPRIPSRPEQTWPEEWEDGWSGDVLFFLTREDPDEAWALCLELLAVSADPAWASTIGAFIVEELLHDHGDAFIDRIEAEAAKNERLRMALPTTRWMVPEHLMARVSAAAGPYWNRTP
jgi:hypothetical protein